MKKTQFWKEPEVHFISSQDKRDEKKTTDTEKVKRFSNTQYLLRIMH